MIVILKVVGVCLFVLAASYVIAFVSQLGEKSDDNTTHAARNALD